MSHKELTVKAKYEILEKMSVDYCVYEVENDDYHSSYKKVIDDIEKCCKHSSWVSWQFEYKSLYSLFYEISSMDKRKIFIVWIQKN